MNNINYTLGCDQLQDIWLANVPRVTLFLYTTHATITRHSRIKIGEKWVRTACSSGSAKHLNLLSAEHPQNEPAHGTTFTVTVLHVGAKEILAYTA